mgnify:FL=1
MGSQNTKIQKAWTFYDWANSVYPLVISSAIFPVFYEGYVDEKVIFFGFEFINTALITILSSCYFLLLVLILPVLSGIADSTGNKKAFMQFFCYLGSFCCVLLSFFDKNHLEISMLLFVMAGIGFWSSLVFYNAFLPEIAEKKDHDSLSARGFSMGYIGSVILLVICLFLIFNAQESERSFYTRLCFALTGLWWFSFSQITFKSLPSGEKIRIKDRSTYHKGILELNKVRLYIMKTKRLKKFIYSFFVYSMAVQTIMLVAVYFGTKEVNWGEGANAKMGLIIGVLLIQLIAIPGAILLSKISKFKGNLYALKLVVFIWILLCLSALLVYEPIHFYLISGFVGLVMGGIQSLSRSTYSKYIPSNSKDTSSFFSFYDISEKLGIVIGMFSYGFIEQVTGSMRNSIVALVVFFIVGLLLLFQVPKEEIPIENYG